ncbi:MAG: hypothetical protein QXF41_02690 [Candidatus Micrarchaeaceae archaeon]
MQQLPFGIYGYGIAVSLIGIMLAIGGIILGLGFAFNDKKLKEFGENELYQAIISGVLVGSLLLLFSNGGIVSRFIYSAAVSNGTSFSCPAYMSQNAALCFSYAYLVGTQQYVFAGHAYNSLFIIIMGILLALLAITFSLGLVAGIKLDAIAVSVAFNYALAPILKELQQIITLLSAALISIFVQAALLQVIALTALPIILPLGIILRVLYPTRRLGGFLIAVAIGVYVVLPLSYLLNAYMMNSYNSDFNATSLSQVEMQSNSLSSSIGSYSAYNSSLSLNLFNGFLGGIGAIIAAINSLLKPMFYFVSGIIVQAFILPTFSIILTIISIRELSRVSGSEAIFRNFKLI